MCVCGFLFFLSGESCPHFEEWCLKPPTTHTHTHTHVFWRDSRISTQTHSELNSRSHSFTTSSLSITDTVRQLQLFCSIFFMQLDLLRFRWSSFSQPWCSIMTRTEQGFHTSHHTSHTRTRHVSWSRFLNSVGRNYGARMLHTILWDKTRQSFSFTSSLCCLGRIRDNLMFIVMFWWGSETDSRGSWHLPHYLWGCRERVYKLLKKSLVDYSSPLIIPIGILCRWKAWLVTFTTRYNL